MRKLSVASVLLLLAACGTAAAAPTYSIDYQGPTAGMAIISEGDILTRVPPGTPAVAPAVVIPVGALGVMPGVMGMQEVDALSYGHDVLVMPDWPSTWTFSVDEFAIGLQGNVGSIIPSVFFEGASGPNGVGPGIGEAAADVFYAIPPPGPIPPLAVMWPNAQLYDGDGIPDVAGAAMAGNPVCSQPGLNLIEPNVPTPMQVPDPGDNLDALDMDTTSKDLTGGGPVYFSLDSYWPDPLESPGLPPNTGTAVGQGMGFVGGDVLVVQPGGMPMVYAQAFMLGLDWFGGPDSDDLDALILRDNGNGIYDPVEGPFSWLAGTDMLFFSVSRGSAIIGMPDTLWGAPIEEGDILIPMGPGIAPAIFIPAEALGLTTVRAQMAGMEPIIMWGIPNPAYFGQDIWGDDLDALDVVPEPCGIALLGLTLLAQRRRRRVI